MLNKSFDLYGLVLAGGKSVRMGEDKGKIKWHGYEQRYFLSDLLSRYCDKTFISVRPDQKNEIDSKYKVLTDSYHNLGQYGAILTSFDSYSDKAFLVVACDLPLVDRECIEYLIQKRDTKKIATSYKNIKDNLPEPLIGIWEAKSAEVLHTLLKEGITCPRKALIKNSKKVKLVNPLVPEWIMNVNTKEERQIAKEIIKKKG